MNLSKTIIFASLLILLAFVAGTIFLQIFLSKSKNKWLGLVLPCICFAFSLLALFSVPAFNNQRVDLQEILPDGSVITHEMPQSVDAKVDAGQVTLQIAAVFFFYNIPTVILLLIYFGCRQKITKLHQINQMNILDLE